MIAELEHKVLVFKQTGREEICVGIQGELPSGFDCTKTFTKGMYIKKGSNPIGHHYNYLEIKHMIYAELL